MVLTTIVITRLAAGLDPTGGAPEARGCATVRPLADTAA